MFCHPLELKPLLNMREQNQRIVQVRRPHAVAAAGTCRGQHGNL